MKRARVKRSPADVVLGRRELLLGGAGLAALLVLPGCSTATDHGAADLGSTGNEPDLFGRDFAGADLQPTPMCEETVEQILGPFYRPDAPVRTALPTSTQQKPLVVRGRVRGDRQGCAQLVDALVEIWQADEVGMYDNTTPQYLLRGSQRTASDGSYQFETILPGWYLNGNTYRPRHIHYKVSAPGFRTLVTQLYFKDDPYLPTDPFYHPSLVMPLSDLGASYEAIFDIVLASA